MSNYKKLCASSILEKEFLQALQNPSLKVISFDIFETLAFRDVNEPTDIFSLVGEHKYVQKIYDTPDTFKEYRVQAEKKARVTNSKLEDVTLELIYNELPLTNKQRKKIMQLELQEEFKSLYINKQMQNWIQKAYKAKKKVILISDMYLSKKQLQKLLLSKLKNRKHISKIYVSNEHNATKATGNLYSKVLKELHISANAIYHVGDNAYTDIKMAQMKGISALHYNSENTLKEMFTLESHYIKHNPKHNNYRMQASLLNPYSAKNERFFFNLGATVFGAVLWEFSHWVNRVAQTNDISQINCIMREGRVFSKYISKINRELDVNRLYASRKSTFLPALNLQSLQKYGFNFYNYRKFSVANFYDLFKLKITHQFILKNSTLLLQNANEIQYKNKNLLDYITQDFKERMSEVEKNVTHEKKLFKKYLQQLSYKEDSILIDFGGTGSILENISNTLKGEYTQKINLLFYMHSSGFEKMLHSKTLTFLPFNNNTKEKIERIRRSPEFLEILFNGVKQTTLCYEERKDKKVRAVTDFPYKNIDKTQKISQAFDKGIDAFFELLKVHKQSESLYSSQTVLDFISRLIEVPTLQEATALGNLYHDEGYGDVKVKELITSEHKETILKTGIEATYLQNANSSAYKIGQIPWVQGVITQLDPEYIVKINSLKSQGVNEGSIEKITDILSQNSHIKEVYIYGAGQFFTELSPILKKLKIKIIGVLDTRAKFSPFTIDHFDVKCLEEAELKDGATIIVSSAVFAIEITQTIINFAQSEKKELSIMNFYNGFVRV